MLSERSEKVKNEDKPYIYVCSPYAGKEDNYRRAIRFGQYVVRNGGIPIIPHTMLHGVLDDMIPEQRRVGLEVGRRLLKMCDAVWVFGTEENASAGMAAEINLAGNNGVPVVFVDVSKVWGADELTLALSKCGQHYQQIYSTINTFIVEEFKYYINSGITPELICECIDRAQKKKSTWSYSKVILNACLREGVYTKEQYLESRRQYLESRNKKKAEINSAISYDVDLFNKMLYEDD